MIQRRSDDAFFKAPRNFCKRDAKGFPIGPKTKRRQAENRKLNKLPDSVKKVCELRTSVCIGNRYLTWAHSKKSRHLCTDKDWQEAVRACLACHDHVEKKSHKEMHRIITEAIARRKTHAH